MDGPLSIILLIFWFIKYPEVAVASVPKVLLQEACIIDALGMVELKHTLLQSAFFLKSSEQLLQIALRQETLWNAAGNEDGN